MLRERAKPGDPYVAPKYNVYFLLFRDSMNTSNTISLLKIHLLSVKETIKDQTVYNFYTDFITTQQNNNSAHFFNFTCKPKEVIRHNTYLNKEIIGLPKPSLISGTDINVPEIKQNHEIIWGILF